MAHYFSSDPTNISLCVRIGIGYKISVKLKFCAQPMHQIYIIKYCILLKTSLSELEWVTRHKCGFHNDSFQVWKKSLPIKILSSFSLTAQPHQKITNRSNKQINDTDKRGYTQIHPPQYC